MTIKEFYEWAVKKGIEDFSITNYGCYGEMTYEPEDFKVDKEKKEVKTFWEC